MSHLSESFVKLEDQRKQELAKARAQQPRNPSQDRSHAFSGWFVFFVTGLALAFVGFVIFSQVQYRRLEGLLQSQRKAVDSQLDVMAKTSQEMAKELEATRRLNQVIQDQSAFVDRRLDQMSEEIQSIDNRGQKLSEDLGEEIRYRNEMVTKQSERSDQLTNRLQEETKALQTWAKQWFDFLSEKVTRLETQSQ